MKLNDNTILRIKVPAHLYESVKAQLTLNEAKQNFGMPGAKTVKVKNSSSGDKPKKTSAPKPKPVAAKAKASKKGDDIPHDGMNKVEGKKKMGLEELQTLAELLNNEISKLQEKSQDIEEKAPVEEKTEAMEEGEKDGE